MKHLRKRDLSLEDYCTDAKVFSLGQSSRVRVFKMPSVHTIYKLTIQTDPMVQVSPSVHMATKYRVSSISTQSVQYCILFVLREREREIQITGQLMV